MKKSKSHEKRMRKALASLKEELDRRYAYDAGEKLYNDYMTAETPEVALEQATQLLVEFRKYFKDNPSDLKRYFPIVLTVFSLEAHDNHDKEEAEKLYRSMYNMLLAAFQGTKE